MIRDRRSGLICSLSGLIVAAFGLTVSAASSAQQYVPTFRLEKLKNSPTGAPNKVLVLGTTHLSELTTPLTPEMLSPLLDRLAAWRPTAIATEDVSGLQCKNLRRYPKRYSESVEFYCADTAPARRATGLDVPGANAEAERILANWPAAPAAAQRRHLAAVFLAAGEPGSALVQWLRLPPAERHVGDGLSDELVSALE